MSKLKRDCGNGINDCQLRQVIDRPRRCLAHANIACSGEGELPIRFRQLQSSKPLPDAEGKNCRPGGKLFVQVDDEWLMT